MLPRAEFSPLPAESITGKSGAAQHRWAMLHTQLLLLLCRVSPRTPSYTSSTSPLVELAKVPQLQLWQEGLGAFGHEHRTGALSAVTCAVSMAGLASMWDAAAPAAPTLGPGSLSSLEAGPLATAQGTCGNGGQVCLSAAAVQCDVS